MADYKISLVHSSNTLQDQLSQILAHLDWFGRPKFYFCRFSHKINSAPWWLNSKSAAFTLCIPFRTNSVIYQPVGTDLGTLKAISVFQSQNKLGPLVADFKIPKSGRVGLPLDHTSQVWLASDNFQGYSCSVNWAISAFQSQNKLGSLVVNQKIRPLLI